MSEKSKSGDFQVVKSRRKSSNSNRCQSARSSGSGTSTSFNQAFRDSSVSVADPQHADSSMTPRERSFGAIAHARDYTEEQMTRRRTTPKQIPQNKAVELKVLRDKHPWAPNRYVSNIFFDFDYNPELTDSVLTRFQPSAEDQGGPASVPRQKSFNRHQATLEEPEIVGRRMNLEKCYDELKTAQKGDNRDRTEVQWWKTKVESGQHALGQGLTQSSNFVSGPIDLHALNVEWALWVVEQRIRITITSPVVIVTGRGAHSVKKKPILRAAVEKFLNENEIRWKEGRDKGSLQIMPKRRNSSETNPSSLPPVLGGKRFARH